MKTMAIYCGASEGNSSIYANELKKLAGWLLDKHYRVVYGGGNNGLMGILADEL